MAWKEWCPVCPHCAYKWEDHSFQEDGFFESDCPSCNGHMEVKVDIETYFSTTRCCVDGKHNFIVDQSLLDKGGPEVKTCSVCKKSVTDWKEFIQRSEGEK